MREQTYITSEGQKYKIEYCRMPYYLFGHGIKNYYGSLLTWHWSVMIVHGRTEIEIASGMAHGFFMHKKMFDILQSNVINYERYKI